MITFKEFTEFLEVIVWPCTLLVVIIIYKKNFNNAFQRLGSLKADATGISLTFDQKIESAKELARAVQSKVIAKDGVGIAPKGSNTSYYPRLLELKQKLDNKLTEIADSNTINTHGATGLTLCNMLTENGSITLQHSKLIAAIYGLVSSASTSISKKQFEEINNLYNALPN